VIEAKRQLLKEENDKLKDLKGYCSVSLVAEGCLGDNYWVPLN
jgi:hypothetical protein